MDWINISERQPVESKNGTSVLVILNAITARMYGNVVISIYYKGKFHKDFCKGYIQDVTYWMPLPEPIINTE